MSCRNGKHDLRFVYQLDDLVDKSVEYTATGMPIVTENRAAHFECRACYWPIEPRWSPFRVYTPEPVAVNYSKYGTTYEYDV